jgi:cytochrome c peroxidase
MLRCISRPALILAAIIAVGSPASAAPPQVPSLPQQLAGYVKYAIQDLPAHFTQTGVSALDNTPPDNLLTDAGATLGRVLFYDKRLSHDGRGSCASCHRQENGFSDPNQFSAGINGQLSTRHSMGLSNSAFYINGRAFWDERASSLEEQALLPIQNPTEMGSTLTEVVQKLSQTTFYPALFQAAFGSPEVTSDRIAKAIAQFERAMVSYQSKYDTAFAPGDTVADFAAVFTPDELAGQAIFHGEGRCFGCHSTNAHVGQQAATIGLDLEIIDPGADVGQFKTPSLRNVGVRGRFMHDGRFSSLLEVAEFYNSGVQDTPTLDFSLREPLQLGLSPQQVQQLAAYLNTLTDETFLTSPLFSDPFVTLPGDYTGDGIVNQADYELWRASVGDATMLVADGNGDNMVDAADYVLWRSNVGLTWQTFLGSSGAGSNSAAIPEPTTAVLIAFTLTLGLTLRRRTRC